MDQDDENQNIEENSSRKATNGEQTEGQALEIDSTSGQKNEDSDVQLENLVENREIPSTSSQTTNPSRRRNYRRRRLLSCSSSDSSDNSAGQKRSKATGTSANNLQETTEATTTGNPETKVDVPEADNTNEPNNVSDDSSSSSSSSSSESDLDDVNPNFVSR